VSATSYADETGTRRSARTRLRSLLRVLGTLAIAAGAGALAWAIVVWRWEDPFTSLYTAYQQHKLEQRYEGRVAGFAPVRATAPLSPAALERAVAAQARRYRSTSKGGDPLGRIAAPRLDLNMILVNGTDSATLRKGPARDERTFMPGEGKLVYVAGHRTTYSAPFARIDAFRRGDRVTLELPYATFVYRVTGHVIVPADAIERLRSRGREELALQACHPRFSARQRYIVYARPVRVIPRGLSAYSPSARGRVTSRPAG
jgi:sortase A